MSQFNVQRKLDHELSCQEMDTCSVWLSLCSMFSSNGLGERVYSGLTSKACSSFWQSLLIGSQVGNKMVAILLSGTSRMKEQNVIYAIFFSNLTKVFLARLGMRASQNRLFIYYVYFVMFGQPGYYLTLSISDMMLYKSRRICMTMHIFFDCRKYTVICGRNTGSLTKLCFMRKCAKQQWKLFCVPVS